MQQHDGTTTTDANAITDWGSNRQRAARQRAAVQREVVRLLDALAPERPPARHDAPTPDVRAYRWPSRCILQGADQALSVSWFPAGADDVALGEMLVIVWDGTVALPGSARQVSVDPVAKHQLLLHPEERDDGAWSWRGPEGGSPDFDCEELATYCRAQLQR